MAGNSLEPECQINRVTDYGIGKAVTGSHVADIDGPCIDTDADCRGWQIETVENFCQRFHLSVHFERCQHSSFCMIFDTGRRSPECHHGIANILVYGCAIAVEDRCHGIEVFVQQFDNFPGIQLFRHAGEIAQVTEKHGQETCFPKEGFLLGFVVEGIDDFRGNKLAEYIQQFLLFPCFCKILDQHIDTEQRQYHQKIELHRQFDITGG